MKESLRELGYIKEEIEKGKKEISNSRKNLLVESSEDVRVMHFDIRELIRKMDKGLKEVGDDYIERCPLGRELKEYCDKLMENYDISTNKPASVEEMLEVFS